MNAMPEKLFQMVQSGVDEITIQTIFDILIEGEERGVKFVNIYLMDKIGTLFLNSRQQADQQLTMFIAKSAVECLAFEYIQETWTERKVEAAG